MTVNSTLTAAEVGRALLLFVCAAHTAWAQERDDAGGYYATAAVSLHHRAVPVFLESILHRSIKTDIETDDDFVWNVSLVYSF